MQGHPVQEYLDAIAAAEARGYERGRTEPMSPAAEAEIAAKLTASYERGRSEADEIAKINMEAMEKRGNDLERRGFLRCREEAAKVAADWATTGDEPWRLAAVIRSLKP